MSILTMPRPIKVSHPIAAVRAMLGMKMPEFAAFVGHGAAMLKRVECGREPAGDRLIEKISVATGVPVSFLAKTRVTTSDRKELENLPAKTVRQGVGGLRISVGTPAFGRIDPDAVTAVELFDRILAAYYSLALSGVNPALMIVALENQLGKVLTRWGVDSAQIERFEHQIYHARLHCPPIGGNLVQVLEAALQDTSLRTAVDKANQENEARLKSVVQGARRRFDAKFESLEAEAARRRNTAVTPPRRAEVEAWYQRELRRLVSKQSEATAGAVMRLSREHEAKAQSSSRSASS